LAEEENAFLTANPDLAVWVRALIHLRKKAASSVSSIHLCFSQARFADGDSHASAAFKADLHCNLHVCVI
jgi:hypothetical protein